MVRQGILASSRWPGEGLSEKLDFLMVDSAGKRRLLYCCHLAKRYFRFKKVVVTHPRH
jgi:hypothetical protein